MQARIHQAPKVPCNQALSVICVLQTSGPFALERKETDRYAGVRPLPHAGPALCRMVLRLAQRPQVPPKGISVSSRGSTGPFHPRPSASIRSCACRAPLRCARAFLRWPSCCRSQSSPDGSGRCLPARIRLPATFHAVPGAVR